MSGALLWLRFLSCDWSRPLYAITSRLPVLPLPFRNLRCILHQNQIIQGRTCPEPLCSPRFSTRGGIGLKPGLRGKWLATNRLINGTARHGCCVDYVDRPWSSNQQPSSYIADETAADITWLSFCNGKSRARKRENDIVLDKEVGVVSLCYDPC